MRFKYRVKTTRQYLAFAFYPKVTLIACVALAVIVLVVLGLVMMMTPDDSVWYNIVFALNTGAVASFFVSFVIELTNNYRHNKLAWYELQDYYYVVTSYEAMKQYLMQRTPLQREEKKVHDVAMAAGELDDLDLDDSPMDLIQATWEQLPTIMPVLQKTLEDKKAFLSDAEIVELKNIMLDFSNIRAEIKRIIMFSPLRYNVLNHPDEEILSSHYSKNVLADMPDWMRKHIASNESEASLDRLVDAILGDVFLLTHFMEGYDISQQGIDNYHDSFDEKDWTPEEAEEDDYDYSEPEDEEEFRALKEAQGQQLLDELRPFIAWHVSQSCLNMAESLDLLEKAIRKQPYYSMLLEFDKECEKAAPDSL